MTEKRLAAIEKELAEIKERLDAQCEGHSHSNCVLFPKAFADYAKKDKDMALVLIYLVSGTDKDNTTTLSIRKLSKEANIEYSKTRRILSDLSKKGFIEKLTDISDSNISRFKISL